MKKVVVFLVVLVSTFVLATGFDGFEWGTRPEVVRVKYWNKEYVDSYNKETDEFIIYTKDSMLGHEVDKTFGFHKDGLFIGGIVFNLSHYNQDDAYYLYFRIKELLEAKYGEPYSYDPGWSSERMERVYSNSSDKEKNDKMFTGDYSPATAWGIGDTESYADPDAMVISLYISVTEWLSEISINVAYANPMRFKAFSDAKKQIEKELF